MVNASMVMKDIEQEFNLFNIRMREFPIWYFSRHKIYEYIIGIIQGNKVSNTNSGGFSRYLGSFNFKPNRYKHSDILCVSVTALRREEHEGKKFDILFDYIGKYDDKNKYSVLNTLSGKGFQKNYYSNLCYNMSNLTFYIQLYKKFNTLIIKEEEIKKLKLLALKINDYIFKKYELKVDIERILLENTSALFGCYKIAYKVIKRVNPRVLYVECAYSPTHLMFIYAAKSLGIKVVEFQHGLINENHLGYMFNENPNKNDPIPDCICVFGSYFKNLIESMNKNFKIEVIEYGYPYLYEKAKEVIDYTGDKKYKYLITTQGALYSREWCKFIKELLATDNKAKILVKVHPNEVFDYKKLYSSVINEENVEFIFDKNIYECLKISRIHLSCFSTCHYEALSCNIPTYVIKLSGWWNVKNLAYYGVKFIDTPYELMSFVEDSCNFVDFNSFKREYFNFDNKKSDLNFIKDRLKSINRRFV